MTDNKTLEELQNEIAAIFDSFLDELSDGKTSKKKETIGSN